MVRKTIQDRVIKVVSQQLDVDFADIKPEHHLIDDLKADSLDFVELVMAIEMEFEIEIPDSEAEKLMTVQSIIDKMIAENPELVWTPKKEFNISLVYKGDILLNFKNIKIVKTYIYV